MDVIDEPDATGSSRGRLIGVVIGSILAAAVVVMLILGLARGGDSDLTLDRGALNKDPQPAPDFTLPLLADDPALGQAGATVTLSSLRNRPVVLNIWASWCGPCEEEAPLLEALATDYKGRGVVVLGMNTQDVPDKAVEFIRDHKLTFPSVRDGTSKTERAFGTTGVPETFVIDPDGRVRFVPLRGQLTEPTMKDIRAYLDTLVPR